MSRKRRNTELVHVKPVRPPGKDWRTAAWRNGHRPDSEQYALELMRHGLTDKLEDFISRVEQGEEPLEPSERGWVQWRSRNILDHDLAEKVKAKLQIDWDRIHWPVMKPAADTATVQLPRLYDVTVKRGAGKLWGVVEQPRKKRWWQR